LYNCFKVYRLNKLDKRNRSLSIIQTPAFSLPAMESGTATTACANLGWKIILKMTINTIDTREKN